jgi:flavin reductase (DIM6/NTAB) family NADH-FMN oxidoreductase RutF
MARLAGGTVVICAPLASGYRGLAATSFTAASLDPPLVLVCLDRLSATRDAVAESRVFSVSLLERRQEFLAERFAGRAPLVDAAWRQVPHDHSPVGLPIIRGCLAWVECRLRAMHTAGDHDITVGEVTAAGLGSGEPLVLWDRSFWGVS